MWGTLAWILGVAAVLVIAVLALLWLLNKGIDEIERDGL